MKITNFLRRCGSGKNIKLFYLINNGVRWLMPNTFYRRRLAPTLAQLPNRADQDYIQGRVDYCNKLQTITPLPEDAPTLAELCYAVAGTVYYFDAFEYVRWFDPALRWKHRTGDVIEVPPTPAIVKSRPIVGDNANSVLLNQDKVRHFTFLNDTIPFSQKQPKAIFRGLIYQENRKRFARQYFGNPLFDIGAVGRIFEGCEQEWLTKKMSLWEHLRYQFIFALEGNDVASNLKWVMSSNSVAVMPKPRYETWFMEGRLVPNFHYIEVRPDFSDVEERLRYYIERPQEAEAIARNANKFVAQFFDAERERLISLLVLQKYFRMTGQLS